MKFVLGTISLIGAVLFFQAFTPHPFIVTGLLFALARLYSAHLEFELLNAKMANAEAARLRQTERLDQIEWRMIYGTFKGRGY